MKKGSRVLSAGLTLGLLLALVASVGFAQGSGPQAALGTAFTYQGRLTDAGQAVDGTCDLRFRLYNAAVEGVQVGSTQTVAAVAVAGGLFTLQLDFGAAAFDGQARWLEMEVRCPAGSGSYTLLSPRQPLTAAPYALYALAGPYAAGTGLELAGSIFSLAAAYRLPQACANGQVAKWDGSAWVCAADDAGAGGDCWSLTGNAGTTPGTHYLGTTDAVTLTLAVDGEPALRIGPSSAAPNLLGGYAGNWMAAGIDGATIGGGGSATGCGAMGTVACPNRVTGDFGAVGGGLDNEASGRASTVAGGEYNGSTAEGATVAGGYTNFAEGLYAAVGGGTSNSAAADHATVGGGEDNSASGATATIGGGKGNGAQGGFATIGGGAENVASGTYATVAGGYQNTAEFTDCTVGGGSGNAATYYCATVAGGCNNSADASATVGGGDSNSATGGFATVAGGVRNTASGSWSTVGGGYRNEALATAATIAGGGWPCGSESMPCPNRVTDTGGTVGGGVLNQAGDGDGDEWDAEYATVAGGSNNNAGAQYSTIPGGADATASHYGQMAYAAGGFGGQGQAQTSVYVLRNTTANATLTELFLDGSSARLTLDSGRTLTFDILVVGRSDTGQSAGYRAQGVIENHNGNTSFIGSPAVVALGEDVAGWNVLVQADNASDALVLKVSGSAGASVRWVARVQTAEVSW